MFTIVGPFAKVFHKNWRNKNKLARRKQILELNPLRHICTVINSKEKRPSIVGRIISREQFDAESIVIGTAVSRRLS